MSKKKLKFEEALARLEEIAGQIERGEIGLEESITRYEEGMELARQCREILNHAEQRILKLQERPDGTAETSTFRPAAEADEEEDET